MLGVNLSACSSFTHMLALGEGIHFNTSAPDLREAGEE